VEVRKWVQRAWLAGFVTANASGLAMDALAGELRRGILPPRCTEAPVEPAPPNAGYYPTWWNRWDTEAAYLPGKRRTEGPPETKPKEEALPKPNGGIDLLPPLTPPPSTPREKEPPPKPPATPPKPAEPAPAPTNGDLPPLPDGPEKTPEPMPVPPAPGPKAPAPGPEIFEPPADQDKKPDEPAPMELPAPVPKEEKQAEPKPRASEPQEPVKPKPKEAPKKDPGESDLFEAPPRDEVDKDKKQSLNMPVPLNLPTTRANGRWVASGGSRREGQRRDYAVAPASDQEDAFCPTQAKSDVSSADPPPVRLRTDADAVPLSDLPPRSATVTGNERATPTSRRDSAVRPVQWIEAAEEGRQTLPNPLRRK